MISKSIVMHCEKQNIQRFKTKPNHLEANTKRKRKHNRNEPILPQRKPQKLLKILKWKTFFLSFENFVFKT